jgi:drug/metabolite transporter (DMT)-like permease
MNNYIKGAALLVTAACGYGLIPVFAAYAYKGNVSTSTLLFLRFFIAALFLLVLVFVKYNKIYITKKEWFFFFLLGAVLYNIQSRCFFMSIELIPASLTSLILYTYPAIVMVLSAIFYKEKITLKTTGSIGVVFIGLIMLLGSSVLYIGDK